MNEELLVKTIEHKGHTIKIYRDDEADSPREWDNLGVMYSNHKRYSPDHKSIDDLISMVGGNTYANTIPFDLIEKDHYYVKVWMYDHSGQTIRVGENNPWGTGYMSWDSGLFAVLAVSKERAKKEYNYKRACKSLKEKVINTLTHEVQVMDQWMQGEVWGFVIEDAEGNHEDSCWGYFSMEQLMDDAKDWIDSGVVGK